MNDDNLKDGICPSTGRSCYPAIVEASRIIAAYKAKRRQKEAEQSESLETVIIFNSLISAMLVFILLLLTVEIGGLVFVIAAIIALLPWGLYKIERRLTDG